MKKLSIINKFMCQLKYKNHTDYFTIKGRFFHWTVIILPYFWLILGLHLLFQGEFVKWIFTGLIAFAISILIAPLFLFEIKINTNLITIKLLFWFIPFKTIKSKTNDLIINHQDAKHLTLISKRKDDYCEDLKNNLKFTYLIPFDENDYEFYIDFKNKEIDFYICNPDKLWSKLISGLKQLEKST